ncbi:MAG: hypothetical protein WCX30_02910 [Candidatus Paceibacterota bacterium]|jgi:hypothetical protein
MTNVQTTLSGGLIIPAQGTIEEKYIPETQQKLPINSDNGDSQFA